MLKIFIVEDELTATRRLMRVLIETGVPYQIIATADSVEDAVNYLRFGDKPDIILMDIHLSDGSCFEIFKQIEIKIPVIFITAYDQYAIDAFRVNSIDYLLKPVKTAGLKAALEKFATLRRPAEAIYDVLKEMNSQKAVYKKRFIVKSGNTLQAISTSEIALFFAEDKVVMLLTFDGRRFIVDHSLDKLEEMLDPSDFFRVSRKIILHDTAIKNMSPWFRGKIKIETILTNEMEVVVSAEKSAAFKSWLETGGKDSI
jgi:two-component system, LytTR family, response regulator LytT